MVENAIRMSLTRCYVTYKTRLFVVFSSFISTHSFYSFPFLISFFDSRTLSLSLSSSYIVKMAKLCRNQGIEFNRLNMSYYFHIMLNQGSIDCTSLKLCIFIKSFSFFFFTYIFDTKSFFFDSDTE